MKLANEDDIERIGKDLNEWDRIEKYRYMRRLINYKTAKRIVASTFYDKYGYNVVIEDNCLYIADKEFK